MLVGVGFVGIGSAWVVSGPAARDQHNGITICHATASASNPFVTETPDADSITQGPNGHAHHPDDIIPPFVVIENGDVTVNYPGMNMSTLYGAGYTGAEVLANDCNIPSGEITESTTTVTSTVTTTVPVTVTQPGTTITLPALTTTTVVTATVTVPATTVTEPGKTTTVTVPSGETTTVSLPPQTVTVPPSTVTIPGGEVERPALTVTLPGTTKTVTAGATATTVTVTTPHPPTTEGGVLATKVVTVHITTPGHTVTLHAHVIHVKDPVRLTHTKVIVIVVHARGCPPGSVAQNGVCTHIGVGKG
jgi:hypothetical protein